jgi:hypothetical protein
MFAVACTRTYMFVEHPESFNMFECSNMFVEHVCPCKGGFNVGRRTTEMIDLRVIKYDCTWLYVGHTVVYCPPGLMTTLNLRFQFQYVGHKFQDVLK